MKVCAIRDLAAEAFLRPFFVAAVGVAVRDFQATVANPDANNPMHHHAADFELYLLGDFDERLGTFTLSPLPQRLATAKDMLLPS